MYDRVAEIAAALEVPEVRVTREVAGAIRRSEPDAREVYAVINARRLVARRDTKGHWHLSLEPRPQPWERRSSASSNPSTP